MRGLFVKRISLGEYHKPSTHTCPSGTTTSWSGYGGRVLTTSPSRAKILLTSILFGLSGELQTPFTTLKETKIKKDWPKGNNIVTITLSQCMDRKTIEYDKISPCRSVRIESRLARTSWIEGIGKGNRRTVNPHLHAWSRYNFDIIEVMTEKDTGGQPVYYWPRSLPKAHGIWKDTWTGEKEKDWTTRTKALSRCVITNLKIEYYIELLSSSYFGRFRPNVPNFRNVYFLLLVDGNDWITRNLLKLTELPKKTSLGTLRQPQARLPQSARFIYFLGGHVVTTWPVI